MKKGEIVCWVFSRRSSIESQAKNEEVKGGGGRNVRQKTKNKKVVNNEETQKRLSVGSPPNSLRVVGSFLWQIEFELVRTAWHVQENKLFSCFGCIILVL